VFGFAANVAGSTFSRYQENQADVYSLEVTRGIVADPGQACALSFQNYGEKVLVDPDPNPLQVFLIRPFVTVFAFALPMIPRRRANLPDSSNDFRAPRSCALIPGVSRFDMLQDPEQFNEALLHSLSHPHEQNGEKQVVRERQNSNHR
jgi:hypothetical protein